MAPIRHKYYQKPMASKLVISGTSSMPGKVKKLILINEELRRIRNNSLMSDFSENISTLKEFNIAMFMSGHTENFRLEVTSSIIEKYKMQLDNHDNKVTHFYRTKAERAEYKRENKVQYRTKTGWHEKLGYRAVLNIPPTPNS